MYIVCYYIENNGPVETCFLFYCETEKEATSWVEKAEAYQAKKIRDRSLLSQIKNNVEQKEYEMVKNHLNARNNEDEIWDNVLNEYNVELIEFGVEKIPSVENFILR